MANYDVYDQAASPTYMSEFDAQGSSGVGGASKGAAMSGNPYLTAGLAGLEVYNSALKAKNRQKQIEHQSRLQHKNSMMNALESLIGVSRGL